MNLENQRSAVQKALRRRPVFNELPPPLAATATVLGLVHICLRNPFQIPETNKIQQNLNQNIKGFNAWTCKSGLKSQTNELNKTEPDHSGGGGPEFVWTDILLVVL